MESMFTIVNIKLHTYFMTYIVQLPQFLLVTWWWPKTGVETCLHLKIKIKNTYDTSCVSTYLNLSHAYADFCKACQKKKIAHFILLVP